MIRHCCKLLDESPQAAGDAIAGGVDKVFLTGSAATGTAVLQQLAAHLTPAVMELSGCDAVFVLPGADLDAYGRGADLRTALQRFGHLHGAAAALSWWVTILAWCRHLLDAVASIFLPSRCPPVLRCSLPTCCRMRRRLGGRLLMDGSMAELRYAVIIKATPDMRMAQSDIFAPVLCIFDVPDIGRCDSCARSLSLCADRGYLRTRARGAQLGFAASGRHRLDQRPDRRRRPIRASVSAAANRADSA